MILTVPIPRIPQYCILNDGSVVVNQRDQVQFNNEVNAALTTAAHNFLEFESIIKNLKKDVDDNKILARHFMQFVETNHPNVLKEYTTTLLVQAKLEQANGQ